MERSALHLLAKRGTSQRQIAEELGRNRRTVARVLREPVDRAPVQRFRRSKVDPYRPQIARWIGEGLTAARRWWCPSVSRGRRAPRGNPGAGSRRLALLLPAEGHGSMASAGSPLCSGRRARWYDISIEINTPTRHVL